MPVLFEADVCTSANRDLGLQSAGMAMSLDAALLPPNEPENKVHAWAEGHQIWNSCNLASFCCKSQTKIGSSWEANLLLRRGLPCISASDSLANLIAISRVGKTQQ